MRHALRLVLLLAVLLVACGPNAPSYDALMGDATTAANTARVGIETAETTALAAYEAAQLAVIAKAKADGVESASVVKERIDQLRADWQPVWATLDKARTAHALLVGALTAYDEGRDVVVEGQKLAASALEVAKRTTDLAAAQAAVADVLAKLRKARP